MADRLPQRKKHSEDVFKTSMAADSTNCNVESHLHTWKKFEVVGERDSNEARAIPAAKCRTAPVIAMAGIVSRSENMRTLLAKKI